MKRYVLVFLLAAINACSSIAAPITQPTPITQSNNEVQMPHYSVVVPPEKGWHLSMPVNNKFEAAYISKDIGPFNFLIQTMVIPIYDEKKKAESAKWIADDYRNLEHQKMLKESVAQKQYQLQDVLMEEENYGDKKYYTMRYTTTSASRSQNAKLLLYFPKQEKNEYFILVHYSEKGPSKELTDDNPQRSELDDVLKSIRVIQ